MLLCNTHSSTAAGETRSLSFLAESEPSEELQRYLSADALLLHFISPRVKEIAHERNRKYTARQEHFFIFTLQALYTTLKRSVHSLRHKIILWCHRKHANQVTRKHRSQGLSSSRLLVARFRVGREKMRDQLFFCFFFISNILLDQTVFAVILTEWQFSTRSQVHALSSDWSRNRKVLRCFGEEMPNTVFLSFPSNKIPKSLAAQSILVAPQ